MSDTLIVPFQPGRGTPHKTAGDGGPLYPARAARLLALAHALDARLAAGEFLDQAHMARALGFTRARITQIMDLLFIAPDIQEEVLFLEFPPGRQPVSGRDLQALARIPVWEDQRRRWASVRSGFRTP